MGHMFQLLSERIKAGLLHWPVRASLHPYDTKLQLLRHPFSLPQRFSIGSIGRGTLSTQHDIRYILSYPSLLMSYRGILRVYTPSVSVDLKAKIYKSLGHKMSAEVTVFEALGVYGKESSREGAACDQHLLKRDLYVPSLKVLGLGHKLGDCWF